MRIKFNHEEAMGNIAFLNGNNTRGVYEGPLIIAGPSNGGQSQDWSDEISDLDTRVDAVETRPVAPDLSDEVASVTNEVIQARGARSTLNKRITNLANFASPNAGGVIPGRFYDQAFHGSNSANTSIPASSLRVSPYFTSVPFRIDRIGVAIATGATGALGQVVIYDDGEDSWPNNLVWSGPMDLSLGSTGSQLHEIDFTFDPGRAYWLGFRVNEISGVSLRGIPTTSTVNLGLQNSANASYMTCLQQTVTGSLPATWGPVDASQLMANTPPVSIRMRAA